MAGCSFAKLAAELRGINVEVNVFLAPVTYIQDADGFAPHMANSPQSRQDRHLGSFPRMGVNKMFKQIWSTIGVLGLAAAMAMPGTPAQAQGGVRIGTLTCNVASGWGFVFGSSRQLRCVFSSGPGSEDHYTGTISRFGADIGFTRGGVLVWAVFAPTTNISPGALAGNFAGATASAAVGVGAGANVLIGGSNRTVSLQPLSIEGNTGLNVAAGIGAISLRFEGSAGR